MASGDDLVEAGQVRSAELERANALMHEAVIALRALSYPDYLRSEHWLDFRDGMLRAIPICQRCNTANSQQVHHLTYDYLGRERAADVLVLCSSCHAEWHDQHKGERLSTSTHDLVWAGRTRRFGR